MPALLRILDGPQAGATCEVRVGGRVVLGRGEESDLHVLDSWASRAHCALEYAPEGILLEDLQSKNGTYVSGQRVARCRLPDGSILQIGTTTIQVVLEPSGSGAVPVAAPSRGFSVGRAVTFVLLASVVFGLGYGGYRFVRPLISSRLEGRGAANAEEGPGGRYVSVPPSRAGTVRKTFTSEPSGAMVFIDDVWRGPTPLEHIEVALGEHTLRVQKKGYAVHRGTITIGKSQAAPVHIVLKLAEHGSLDIRSTPDGATVYLDQEERGKTPLLIDKLEPQTYTVRLRLEKFADWQQEVTVAPSQTTVLNARLGHREIGYYLAKLKTDPNNVSCYSELAHLYLLEKNVDQCIHNLAKGIEVSLFGHDTSRPEPYRRRLIWLIDKIYMNNFFEYGDEAFVAKVRTRIGAMFADLVGKHPDSSSLLSLIGRLYKNAKTPARMVPIYLKLAEVQPTNLSHYARAAAILQRAGNHADAERIIKKVLKTVPNDYRVHLFLGHVHLAAKERGIPGAREKAIQALNAALQTCNDEAAKREIRRLLGQATR